MPVMLLAPKPCTTLLLLVLHATPASAATNVCTVIVMPVHTTAGRLKCAICTAHCLSTCRKDTTAGTTGICSPKCLKRTQHTECLTAHGSAVQEYPATQFQSITMQGCSPSQVAVFLERLWVLSSTLCFWQKVLKQMPSSQKGANKALCVA